MEKAEIEAWLEELEIIKDEFRLAIKDIEKKQIDRAYQYSKQLSDFCWQEIKRRREKK